MRKTLPLVVILTAGQKNIETLLDGLAEIQRRCLRCDS